MLPALREALRLPNPQTSQKKVHELLAQQLERLSPASKIRTTDYFNHSWIPDLVVTEPDSTDRRLFVRFAVDGATLTDDLRHLNSDGPIFLDLASATTEHDFSSADEQEPRITELRDAVGRQASPRGPLVTDAYAIDEFDRQVRLDKDFRTATRQVVAGGEGVIDKQLANEIGTTWNQASAATASADSELLREALNSVERFLSRDSVLGLEGELRSRWVAAGRSPETFPGRNDWDAHDHGVNEISRLALSIIRSGEPTTSSQWQELLSQISMSDLGHELARIGEFHEGHAVNALVESKIRDWTAQYAYVPGLESESIGGFGWSIGKYSVGLNLINRMAFFTDIGRKWSRVPRAKLLPSASLRLPTLGYAGVRGVGLITSQESIQQTLRPTSTLTLAERVEQVLEQTDDFAFRAARLTSLEVRVAGTPATAYIDFVRNVVRTDHAIPLADYAVLCARFVAGLSDKEVDRLSQSLGN